MKQLALGCLLLPLRLALRFVALVFGVVGRFVTITCGFMLIVIGVIISLTVIGIIVGLPIMILGFLLMIRGVLR